MSLQTGTRLGPYEIISLLGAGGMGEVYRAHDTRLKRDVAIKALPAEFSRDPERLARAEREGEVLASINHPHIAQIYGREDADGTPCLVMELVEGDTLHDRLVHGPIPVEEALELARQIADALEAAHERGVVHRDLKPANVKITTHRNVKVLDFGLAKSVDSTKRGDLSESPTLLPSMTGDRILGTAAYMSPEQAKGQPADARSDIWAFGVVLYEMLTGKPTFSGDSMMDILGGVLRADPDWDALPPETPPIVRSLLRRCLQKDRHRRLHHIADARIEIEEALHEPVRTPAAVKGTLGARARWWMAAMFVAVVATAVTLLYLRPAPVRGPEARLQIVTPRASRPASFAMSPDGRTVVFEAVADGKSQLWLRLLERETAEPLSGTDGAAHPFWSPDGRSVGFFADQKLKRKDIAGGSPIALADASTETFGGTWNADGTILFGPSNTSPLYRVSDRGGQPQAATRIESPQQGGHRFPHFLPDGRRFLFFAAGTATARGVYVGSLDSQESRRLFDSDSAPVFAPPDHVLFARQGTLFAQQVDVDRLEALGDPFLVAERVFVGALTNIASVALSASEAGLLAYRVPEAPRQLIWFDRSGNRVGTVGPPDAALQSTAIRLSPDDRHAAVARFTGGSVDIFLIELARTGFRRFTFDNAAESGAVWSPDGDRIAFHSFRRGLNDLFEKSVADSSSEKTLLESSENKNIYDWSSDGRFILYSSQNAKTGRDIWALQLDGDRKSFVVVSTAFEDMQARLSPDRRWVAYQSNESGRSEIYVRPFPGPGGYVQVSTTGGSNPEWRGDGREIFYIGLRDGLTAVPVSVSADGKTIATGVPSGLFLLRPGSFYSASRDGQRFLVNTALDDNPTAPITVVLNWARRAK